MRMLFLIFNMYSQRECTRARCHNISLVRTSSARVRTADRLTAHARGLSLTIHIYMYMYICRTTAVHIP